MLITLQAGMNDFRDRPPLQTEESVFLNGAPKAKVRGLKIISRTTGAELPPTGPSQAPLWPRQRRHIICYDTPGIHLIECEVDGPHEGAGIGDDADNPALEAQHAIHVLRCPDFEGEDLKLHHVHGDLMYFQQSPGAKLHQSSLVYGGRHGVHTESGTGVRILDCEIGWVAMWAFDFEPLAHDTVVSDWVCKRTAVFPTRLGLCAAAGMGDVSDVTFDTLAISRSMNTSVYKDAQGVRRHDWHFRNMVGLQPYGSPGGAVMRFGGIDGVNVFKCTQPLQARRPAGDPPMQFIRAVDCTRVLDRSNTNERV